MKTKTAKPGAQSRSRASAGSASISAEHLAEIKLLLEHCEAALTTCGAELWGYRRDLAIECNKRAQRCRVAVKEMAP